MSDFTRRTISLPGQEGEVALVEFGDPDRPIDAIFAHANGFNALTYRQALAPLGGALRILAPDLRGHGRTSLAADPATRQDWMDLSRDLVDLMDALGVDRPIVLAGHSMGARAALMATTLAPERVKALALFDPVMIRRREGLPVGGPSGVGVGLVQAALKRRSRFESRASAIASWRNRGAFATWPEQAVEDYATDGLVETEDGVRLACAPAWEASGYMTSGAGPDAVPVMHNIDRPTTVLKAAAGSTCAVSPDEAEVRRNPNLDLRVVSGTTHFLPIERPDLVQATLRSLAG